LHHYVFVQWSRTDRIPANNVLKQTHRRSPKSGTTRIRVSVEEVEISTSSPSPVNREIAKRVWLINCAHKAARIGQDIVTAERLAGFPIHK
jgi:hypothetical protein